MGKYSDKLDSMPLPEREELRRRRPVAYRDLCFKAHQERGLDSLWYFDQRVAKNPVTYEPLHRPMCERIERWEKRKKLLLAPRGHIKSNIATGEFAAQEIARNPEIRILIASHKQPDSWKFCKLVQNILLSEPYQKTYPYVRQKIGLNSRPEKWSKEGLLVEREKRLVEATVETTSTDAPVTGRHYDLIIFDDLVTKESVATPELIAKTTDFVEGCEALLDPGGRMLFVGTRYDYADEYGRIIDTPALAAEFDIIDEWKACEVDGVPIFPTRFTMADDDECAFEGDPNAKKSIPKIKRTHSVFFVNSQYYNEPIDPNKAMFKLTDIQVIQELPALNNYEYFRVCDLSTDQETESYTAIVTGAVDQQANIYITDVFWGQYTPAEICDELFNGQRRGPKHTWPQVVGFEPAPFERSLRSTLDTRMMQERVVVPYVFLEATQANKAKDERIRGIHWWFSAKKFYVLNACRNKEYLIEEFVRWPRFKRKDIADATAQIPHIMWPAGTPPSQQSVDDKKQARLVILEQRELNAIYNGGKEVYIGNDRLMKPHVAVLGHGVR